MYIYWSNKQSYHEEKLAEIQADSIKEADQKFQELTGLNPISNPWIGCQVGV